MKVIVTGSEGFIGKHLCKRLEKEGHTILGLDRNSGQEALYFEVGDAEFVIHLAAWADVRASINDPKGYWENNVVTTTIIQKACAENNIPLLYASSSCVHDWHRSPYGMSKKVNEETARENQCGLRFTTVFGEGARDTMLIGRLVNNTAKYATNHIRDFIHVDDVVDVILLLMNKEPSEWDPAYDVGTGQGYEISYLANQVCEYDLPVQQGDECEAQNNTANINRLNAAGWPGAKVDVVTYLKENTNKMHI